MTLEISVSYADVSASTLGVIVNTRDKISIQVGEYYQKVRGVPLSNLVYVSFEPGQNVLPLHTFKQIKKSLNRQLPSYIQAQLLTWTVPYRVECMSVTSAFTFGFSNEYCSKKCGKTKKSPYFNSDSSSPYSDFGIRPTMQLAAADFLNARQLIDRGIKSDSTFPAGTGYLVSTSDKNRNVRSAGFNYMLKRLAKLPRLKLINTDYIKDRDDVLFYFTGAAFVKGLKTLKFVPGAIADHLTSFGGMLTNSKQMSILRWLEAGATGSYGTVTEPCNHPQKFPNPAIVVQRYTAGETLLEAYWKSVAWPGEGLFVGEPLAAPFGKKL
ncbi:MAG: TIGR03790 family protein [Gammaproteobacteria bacterium]|nr:TIGR03790 family protein [Gammaproteobacteria bacterium]